MTSASEMRKLIELMEQIELDEGVFDLFKKKPTTTATLSSAKPIASTSNTAASKVTDPFQAQYADLKHKIFTTIKSYEADLENAKARVPGLVKNSLATLGHVKQLLNGLFQKAELAFSAKGKGDMNTYQRLMREFGAMMLQLPRLELAQGEQVRKAGSGSPTGVQDLIEKIMAFIRPFVKKIPATFA